MNKRSRPQSGFWFIWGMPISLALLSCAGLLSALFGDRIWDALSWAALGFPVALIVWCTRARQAKRG